MNSDAEVNATAFAVDQKNVRKILRVCEIACKAGCADVSSIGLASSHRPYGTG